MKRVATASVLVALSATISLGCATAPQSPDRQRRAASNTLQEPRATEPLAGARGVDSPRAQGTLILSTASWSFAGAEGEIIRTPNYRVFTTESDASLIERLPRFLESALSHYRTAVAPLPEPRRQLDTYLLATRVQWRAAAQRLLGEQSRRFTRIQRGGFATRGVGVFYNIGLYDTFAIAAHEGWHQYAQRALSEPMPVWLDEGLATFMEGHRWDRQTPVFLPWANVERFDHLRRAEAEGRLYSLSDLLSVSPDRTLDDPDRMTLTYYAQVWALAHFLYEGQGGRYRDSLRALLIDVADGRLARALAVRLGREEARRAMRARAGPEVFQAYFDEDLDSAETRYERFIERLVEPGSRDAVVAGRSPITGLP